VEVTGNGGANWVELESSPLLDPQWLARDFNLTGLLGSYNAVQFRFIAQDPNPGQVVEAALDDFTIYDANAVGAVGVPERRCRASRSSYRRISRTRSPR
jgi:hypothetical protein